LILAMSDVRHAIEQTRLHVTASGPQGRRERMAREMPMRAETISQIGLKIQ
jgi:hypothetical protein